MNARKLLALAVAATVLVGGVAAVGAATPGNAPTDETPDEANGNAPDDADDAADSDADDESDANETDANAANASEAGQAANASEHAENASAAAAGEQGPPSELPDPVPEHVTSIHEQIQSFLGGDVDHLGNALSGLLGDDGDTTGDDAVENETDSDETASASSVAPVA